MTGEDPTQFGASDPVAAAIGITGAQAVSLQRFAAANGLILPEPASLSVLGVAVLGAMWRRRRAAAA